MTEEISREELIKLRMADWETSTQIGERAMREAFPGMQVLPQEAFLPSPIKIPARKSGDVQVSHRTIRGKTPIIGVRQGIICGQKPVTLTFKGSWKIHELSDKNGVWMTDLPEELHQVASMIHTVKPRGHVLVGGLGLGVVVHYLARLPEVSSITVIEKNPDVILLIAPTLPVKRAAVIEYDIKTFLLESRRRFDCYLLDTWQGTNEATWWEQVMPLKRIIRNKWGLRPDLNCWAEDIMAGQIMGALASKYKNDWMYKGLNGMDQTACVNFITQVGTRPWEAKYGAIVDENLRRN